MNMIKKTVAATLAKSSKKAIKRPVYRYQPLMVKVGTVSVVGRNVKQCVALTKCAKLLGDSTPTQIRSDVMSVYTGASNTITAVKSAKDLAEATPPKIKCFGVSVSAGTVEKALGLLTVAAILYLGVKVVTPMMKKKISSSPSQDGEDEEETFVPQEQTVDEIRNESTLENYDDGQLVGKILFKGDRAIVFSQFGIGKTVMTMGMALDIAHGHISKIVPDNDSNHSPQTVFYYDGENDAEDYTNIFGNHAIGTKNLHIIRKFYFRDVKEWLKDVRKKLKGVRGDATVILDNISCILSTFNANIIRELFLRDFTKIQSDFAPSKVTFIVVAHTNKEKELMGSNNQNNFATSILKLSKRDNDYLQLEIVKNRKYGDMQGKSFLLAKRETDDGFKYDEFVRELDSSEVSHNSDDELESEKPCTCKADRIPDEVKQKMKDWYQKGVDGHGLGAIAKKFPEYNLKPMEVKRILESLGVEF